MHVLKSWSLRQPNLLKQVTPPFLKHTSEPLHERVVQNSCNIWNMSDKRILYGYQIYLGSTWPWSEITFIKASALGCHAHRGIRLSITSANWASPGIFAVQATSMFLINWFITFTAIASSFQAIQLSITAPTLWASNLFTGRKVHQSNRMLQQLCFLKFLC